MIVAVTPISIVLHNFASTAHTYPRWRAEYDGVDRNLILQFKALAAEDEHLKRALVYQTRTLSIQEEAMKFIGMTGNWNAHTIGDNAAGNNALSETGTFNKANEWTGRSRTTPTASPTSDTLTYDAVGNLITNGKGEKYVYDGLGRLREVRLTTENNRIEAAYRHNGLGMRISHADVVATTDRAGTLIEWIQYTAYGSAITNPPGNGDGGVDGADITAFNSIWASGESPRAGLCMNTGSIRDRREGACCFTLLGYDPVGTAARLAACGLNAAGASLGTALAPVTEVIIPAVVPVFVTPGVIIPAVVAVSVIECIATCEREGERNKRECVDALFDGDIPTLDEMYECVQEVIERTSRCILNCGN
jgi:YD repeat-containing protein